MQLCCWAPAASGLGESWAAWSAELPNEHPSAFPLTAAPGYSLPHYGGARVWTQALLPLTIGPHTGDPHPTLRLHGQLSTSPCPILSHTTGIFSQGTGFYPCKHTQTHPSTFCCCWLFMCHQSKHKRTYQTEPEREAVNCLVRGSPDLH